MNTTVYKTSLALIVRHRAACFMLFLVHVFYSSANQVLHELHKPANICYRISCVVLK